jgi:hypothetical protein
MLSDKKMPVTDTCLVYGDIGGEVIRMMRKNPQGDFNGGGDAYGPRYALMDQSIG